MEEARLGNMPGFHWGSLSLASPVQLKPATHVATTSRLHLFTAICLTQKALLIGISPDADANAKPGARTQLGDRALGGIRETMQEDVES